MSGVPGKSLDGLSPQQLLAQLDDIRGLAPVSAWPPAPGWWVLLALIGLGFGIAGIISARRRAWRLSWKGDGMKVLDALEVGLDDKNAQETAGALSAALKRIAMKRHSRAACAALQGKSWLGFLSANDPRGFDWAGRGAVLVEAPYAPPGAGIPPETVRPLIAAAKEWVK